MREIPRPEWMAVEEYVKRSADTPIARCTILVSCKYHTTLIAGILGIPNLVVYCEAHPHYKNKMTHLADSAGFRPLLLSSSGFIDGFDGTIGTLFDS